MRLRAHIELGSGYSAADVKRMLETQEFWTDAALPCTASLMSVEGMCYRSAVFSGQWTMDNGNHSRATEADVQPPEPRIMSHATQGEHLSATKAMSVGPVFITDSIFMRARRIPSLHWKVPTSDTKLFLERTLHLHLYLCQRRPRASLLLSIPTVDTMKALYLQAPSMSPLHRRTPSLLLMSLTVDGCSKARYRQHFRSCSRLEVSFATFGSSHG